MNISAHKKFRGFTLIELLIVIAIMGILAAAVLVAVNPLKRQQQARDAGRKSDVGQLASALQAYVTTPGNGLYPTTSGVATTVLTALTGSGDLTRIPNGPTGDGYMYTVSGATAPNTAAIWATLEGDVSAGYVFCWRSAVGNATVLTAASACTP